VGNVSSRSSDADEIDSIRSKIHGCFQGAHWCRSHGYARERIEEKRSIRSNAKVSFSIS